VIDPTVYPSEGAAQLVSVANDGSVLHGVMQNGYTPGRDWRSAAYFPVPSLPAPEPGARPWQLAGGRLDADCIPQCSLSDLSLYGLPTPASQVPTFSQIPLYGTPLCVGQPGDLFSAVVCGSGDFDGAPFMSYIANPNQSGGWWFGIVANESGTYETTLATFDPSEVSLGLYYVEQPPPTSITSPSGPSGGSTLATATPTLTAAPAVGEASAQYDFRIATAPDGTGAVIDSGWQGQPSWTVPPGSLHDGVTYWATVLDVTSDSVTDPTDPSYVAPAAPGPPVSFTIKERLGDGGPSPTDTIGSPPGSTSTPSQGAPSPGTSTASETVDMVTGNLAVQVGTHSVSSLAGPVGITLSYDSASSSKSKGNNYGLTGQYYADSGNHAFTGSPVGQRTDPSINATWGNAGPVGGLPVPSSFMVRWTGVLSLPAGTWKLGGLTTGGMRVYLGGSGTPSYDDWSGSAGFTAPAFGSATVSGGAQYQVEVDDWDPNQGSQVQLWAENTAGPPAKYLVPSNWLTPVAAGVPPGWSLSASPAAMQWSRAENDGSQIILHAPTGETTTFTRTADGLYHGPPGDHEYLTFDGNSRLQVSTPDNLLYTFNPDGTVASVTSIADDRHPAALQYTYNGNPALLRTITDPVSGRSVTLSYGGNTACPTTTAGMLCKVSYWDGTTTTFGYNGNGQLTSVTDPGGVTSSFGYDSDNRLADIRDALASDYLTAGGSAGTAVACPAGTTGLSVTPTDTQVCYDSSGRVATVTQPAPTPGAARPARTYTYASGYTDVSIAGFSPSSGHAARKVYDAQSRIVQSIDSAGHAATAVWDTRELPIAVADPTGEQTSTIYDAFGNVTDIYGPAPLACFSGGWPANVTPTSPVQGYLPVSNPQGTSGCGIAAISHTHNGYDENITGLAATYWANGQFAGAAAMHATGAGGSASSSFCSPGSGACAQWAAGSPPVNSDASGHWSMRLTGTINLPPNSGIDFGLYDSQPATISIDGRLVVADGPLEHLCCNNYYPGQLNTASSSEDLGGFTAGPHSIEVDFQGSATQLNEFDLRYVLVNDITVQDVPASMLDPAYFLKTSTTDPDGKTTTTSYSDSSIGPEYGLPTSTTVGAGSSAQLTTTTSYEAPGTGSFLRKTSTTLPAGNTTTYAYYTGTDGPVAASCGVAAGTPQGGQLKQETDPDPGGGQARVQQLIYDAAGRQAGTRIGTPGDIASAPWQCTSFDARGRVTQEAWPAVNGSPARTVTYSYAVGGNPLASSVSDASGTISSTADLLGRAISYTDAWGQPTTTSYNQAGQVTLTSGLGASVQLGYNPDTGQPTTTTVNGALLATVSYDTASGRPTGAIYGNGTSAAISYDASGRQSGLSYHGPGGNLLATDTITRTAAGREATETTSQPGTSALLAISYGYDGAGRLTTASDTAGGTDSSRYSYASNPASDNCPNPLAGANTNRTRVTIIGSTPTTTDYCYNNADQLVSTIAGSITHASYAYNERGDQTTDNGTTYTWDSADRAATASTGGITTTSTYDAVNRLIQSAPSTGNAVRYAYSGFTDAPAAVLNINGATLQRLIGLVGGVTVTLQTSGNTWSYPNLQGDTTITTNDVGGVTAGPVTYDPWGNLSPGQSPLATATGPNTLGAYASAGKLTNAATGTVLLGARTFNPAEARFLSVDPVNGGCANPYTYSFGDPFSQPDLTGRDYCWIMRADVARDHAEAIKNSPSLGLLKQVLDRIGVPGAIALVIMAVADQFADGLTAAANTADNMAAEENGTNGISEHPQVVAVVIADFKTIGKTGIPYGPYVMWASTAIPDIDGGIRPENLILSDTIRQVCDHWFGSPA
jgi:RHS repeat-associated protein